MRCGLITVAGLAAALAALSSTTAQAEQWCGYSAQANAMIECGYSNVADCQTATGKGGTCFVDPYVAFNVERKKPALAWIPVAGRNRTKSS
jgi:Protein of unknown function (DUF3551)